MNRLAKKTFTLNFCCISFFIFVGLIDFYAQNGLNAELHLNAAKRLLYQKPDSALWHCNQIINQEVQSPPAEVIAAKRLLAIVYDLRGEYELSLRTFDEVVDGAASINDSIQWANGQLGKGIIFHRLNQHERSLTLYQLAIGVYSRHQETDRATAVMNNITALYNNMGLHQEAVLLYRKMLQKALSANDSGQLSSIYTNIANAFRQLEEIDSAITYNNKGIRVDKARSDQYGLSGGYMTRATIYKDLGMLDSALLYYSKSLKPVEDMFMRSELSAVLGSMSEVYYQKRQYNDALVLIDSCLNLLSKEGENPTLLKQAFEMKAMILGDMGLHKDASLAWQEAYKTAGIIDKSNLDARLIRFAYDTKAGYFDKVIADIESENTSLKARNEQQSRFLFWSAIGAILLAGLLISLYVAWYNRSRYNKMLLEHNEDLLQRLKDRERMLSLLAHDFRSPLQSMRSMLELFESGNLNEQEQTAFISKAKRNIQTALRGIDQMLFWITKDRKTTNKTKVDLSDAIRSSINFYSLEIEQQEVEINYGQLQGTFMNFDPQHLEIIARNIISNSIKYGQKGVKIDIDFSTSDNKEILSFHDNGPGIEPGVLELIESQSFRDLKPKTTGIHSSTGIGLELVFELAKMNNATINVDSSTTSGTSVSVISKG